MAGRDWDIKERKNGFVIEIIPFEGESAIAFPDEILKKLNVKKGDEVEIVEVPGGFEIRSLKKE